MPDLPSNLSVVRSGKSNGEQWVFRITTDAGREIFAIAVSPKIGSRTGPTWSYVFEDGGFRSVDLGSPGSLQSLVDGYKAAGIKLADVSSVIVTHGHSDHDGTVPEFLDMSGAELWAHETYGILKSFNAWDIQDFGASALQVELRRIGKERIALDHIEARLNRDHAYYEGRKSTEVSVHITDGYEFGDLSAFSTPGHSPDQICLKIDDVLFTGDHVLPEITPHPTSKMVLKKKFQEMFSPKIIDSSRLYGLGVYLKSLARMLAFRGEVTVLPAHRLYNRGQYNCIGVDRAGDIMDHHKRRLTRLLQAVTRGESNLEDITEGIFSRSKLLGVNLMAAISEVVAHLEFLEETEDILVTEDGHISRVGPESPNYISSIESFRKAELWS